MKFFNIFKKKKPSNELVFVNGTRIEHSKLTLEDKVSYYLERVIKDPTKYVCIDGEEDMLYFKISNYDFGVDKNGIFSIDYNDEEIFDVSMCNKERYLKPNKEIMDFLEIEYENLLKWKQDVYHRRIATNAYNKIKI